MSSLLFLLSKSKHLTNAFCIILARLFLFDIDLAHTEICPYNDGFVGTVGSTLGTVDSDGSPDGWRLRDGVVLDFFDNDGKLLGIILIDDFVEG